MAKYVQSMGNYRLLKNETNMLFFLSFSYNFPNHATGNKKNRRHYEREMLLMRSIISIQL